jgi:uncharacterized protein YigA (DUF484 family)
MWSSSFEPLHEMVQVIEAWNRELDQRFAELALWQLKQEFRQEQQRYSRVQRARMIQVQSVPEGERIRG